MKYKALVLVLGVLAGTGVAVRPIVSIFQPPSPPLRRIFQSRLFATHRRPAVTRFYWQSSHRIA